MRLLRILAAGLPLVASPANAETILIRNVSVVDPQANIARPHRDVLVSDGTILFVRPTTKRVPTADRVIGAAGKFLIPGLWDSHVHLYALAPGAFQLLVAQGITSVRDMGGKVADLKDWRAQGESGRLIAPRIKFCGPMLEAPDDISLKNVDHEAVDGPAFALAITARLKREGVDCIKTRTINDEETYAALAKAAATHGLPLMGHPPFALDAVRIAGLGQKTFEHAFYPYPFGSLPEPKRQAIKLAFKQSGVNLTPTLIAWSSSKAKPAQLRTTFNSLEPERSSQSYIAPRMHDNWLEGLVDMEQQERGSPGWIRAIDSAAADIDELRRSGIPILAGTDLGAPFVYPETALHDELQHLVNDAKLTPAQALAAATSEPARLFRQESRLGAIKPGMLADLVLLNGNPLTDIAQVRNVDTVISRGRVYGPAERVRMKEQARMATLASWEKRKRAIMSRP